MILSAGSIGTPNILLHSGIGDANELGPLGISSVLNLPSVGKNLSDHPFAILGWTSASTDPLDPYVLEVTLLSQSLQQWMTSRTGPLTSQAINHLAWQRLPSNSSLLAQFGDPSAGANAPHLEFLSRTVEERFSLPVISSFVFAYVHTLHYLGGSITISSNNPLDAPIIDPAFLTTQFDIQALRQAVRSSFAFFSAPAWNGFKGDPVPLVKRRSILLARLVCLPRMLRSGL